MLVLVLVGVVVATLWVVVGPVAVGVPESEPEVTEAPVAVGEKG